MSDTQQSLESMVGTSKCVVRRMEEEGRTVPGWALEQVVLAEKTLAAFLSGEDHRYALNTLILHGDRHKAEQEAFFSE